MRLLISHPPPIQILLSKFLRQELLLGQYYNTTFWGQEYPYSLYKCLFPISNLGTLA